MRPGVPQSFTVRLRSILSNKGIGIFAPIQHDNIDVKAFRHKEVRGSSGGTFACGVRVIAEDDFCRETAKQLRLLGGEGRSARGHRWRRLALKELREVEIPLDEHREAYVANRR